jgi:hypothetical protein
MAEATAKPTVYVETTIISYLTSWPSRDLVRAAHQQMTREWWDTHRENFDVVASELVVAESAAGDSSAANERLRILSTFRLLRVTTAATELARHLVQRGAIPPKAAADALHVALAAANGIDFVLTWNCRHLANAFMRSTIESACVERGFRPPIICTPEGLSGGVGDEG